MRLGVPKALHYYYHFPAWKEFLENKGYTIVVSEETTRETIGKGLRVAPPEICLPVKVYLGHCASLQKKCDALFVPRLVCCLVNKKVYYGCPKVIGLPDLVRATFPKVKIWELTIDERKNPRHGLNLRISREKKGNDTASTFDNRQPFLPTIMLIGHPYLLYDRAINFDLIERIREKGITLFTPFDYWPIDLPQWDKSPFLEISWFYERHLIKAAFAAQKRKGCGIILFYSFGCGTSAVTNELILREIAQPAGIPVLNLIVDEHTQEGGFWTRVESFLEILARRGR